VNSVSFLLRGNPPEPHPRHTESKEIPRQTKKHEVGGGARAETTERERKRDEPAPNLVLGLGSVEWTLRRDGILFADVAEFVFLADIAIFILKKSSRKG
jgi:hypothetical protein